MGSIPIRGSDFFLSPTLVKNGHSIFIINNIVQQLMINIKQALNYYMVHWSITCWSIDKPTVQLAVHLRVSCGIDLMSIKFTIFHYLLHNLIWVCFLCITTYYKSTKRNTKDTKKIIKK